MCEFPQLSKRRLSVQTDSRVVMYEVSVVSDITLEIFQLHGWNAGLPVIVSSPHTLLFDILSSNFFINSKMGILKFFGENTK